MTEKRYFKRMWGDEFYIFDSQTISEKDFDEKVEYEDYRAFADSLMGDEVVDRLNELHEENKQLKKMIFEFNEKAKRFINNPNERPIRTNEDYWVGVNNITSFLMERLNDRE